MLNTEQKLVVLYGTISGALAILAIVQAALYHSRNGLCSLKPLSVESHSNQALAMLPLTSKVVCRPPSLTQQPRTKPTDCRTCQASHPARQTKLASHLYRRDMFLARRLAEAQIHREQ
jgi:hypothetical protein